MRKYQYNDAVIVDLLFNIAPAQLSGERMQLIRIAVFVFATQIPVQVLAQTLAYSDADNPSQAVGMMKTNAFSAQVLLRECSARLPAQAVEMAGQLKRWQTVEAHDIERAEYYWAQMAEKQPAFREQLVQTETYLTESIKLIEKTNPSNKAYAVSIFCRQHFADLASGVWRQRTPRLYQLLDQAP
ncbi:hypothetical protein ACO0LB_10305 [Undibacterium sp. SXout7W]|uniref:hypothetical protein n=1 Tax=Undibacterium sp. SXout7W TaxID=3413049 RepID=UPI003BF12E40